MPFPIPTPVPTFTLSAKPSCQPFLGATDIPSSAPSAAPTESLLEWQSELQQLVERRIEASNNDSSISYQLYYTDLIVNSNQQDGGCMKWSAFIGSDLQSASFFYKPYSLTLLLKDSVDRSLEEVACNDPMHVATILSFLQSSQKNPLRLN
jgi:hypothetical protein